MATMIGCEEAELEAAISNAKLVPGMGLPTVATPTVIHGQTPLMR